MARPDTTEYVASEGGYSLFTATWRPQGDPKALVYIVHGYGEHSGRYDDVATLLTAEGYVVMAHDHYGHGSSDGDKGGILEFEGLVRDLLFLTRRAAAACPALPLFVLAHSLGCIISLRAALRDPQLARGLLLIGPAIALSPEAASPLRIRLGKWLACICPNAVVLTLDSSKICRDEAELQKIEADPLCFKFVRAKFGVEALNAQLDLISRLQELQTPFLVLHGVADAITDISGARLLLDKAASADKELLEFPAAFHQLHHDLQDTRERTFSCMFRWMQERL